MTEIMPIPTTDLIIAMDAIMDAKIDIWKSDLGKIVQPLINKIDISSIHYFKNVILILKTYRANYKSLAYVLYRIKCPIRFVVYLGDARLTETLLQILDYIIEADEAEDVLKSVIVNGDIENLRVLWQSNHISRSIKCNIALSTSICIKNSFINFDDIMPIFARLSEWITFSPNKLSPFALLVEQTISGTDKSHLQLLLQKCKLDVQVKQHYGLDVLPVLFGNSKLSINDLKEFIRNKQLNVNTHSFEGFCAVHYAALSNLTDNIRLLHLLNADFNVLANDGKSPLEYANMKKYCIGLLMQCGASLHSPTIHNEVVLEKIFNNKLKDDTSRYNKVLAQLAIDHHRGVKIKQSVFDEISQESYFEMCLKQVRELSILEVYPSLTLLNIITSKTDILANYITSEATISTIMKMFDSKKFDSYYSSFAELSLEKAYKLYKAKSRAAMIFSRKTSTPINSDNLIIDKIFEYLSYKDIFIFSSA